MGLFGKICIIKSLLFSQFVLPFSLLCVPQHILVQLNRLFYSFIWDGGPDKVRRKCIITSMDEGGLSMLHMESQAAALKAAWVSRLINNRNEIWAFLGYNYLRYISPGLTALC